MKGLQEESAHQMDKVRSASQQGLLSGVVQGVKSAGGLLANGVQAIAGTPRDNERLVGLGLAKVILDGTFLFKPLWNVVMFKLIPLLTRN